MMKKGVTLIVMLLFVGISFSTSTVSISEKSYKNSYFASTTPLYSPHDPIYIMGNDDFTSENGVTGGSGTSDDPYIIEDWEIEATSQNGITVRNASVYFTIRNCKIQNGNINNDGIVFINVTNGVIENNNITRNRNGVIFRTQYVGKENSENNSIRYNTIALNTNDGIHFEHTGWGYHNKNTIFNNNISGNNRGIFMIMSADNQIFFNNIISNNEMGIRLDMCGGGGENNKIYHNNFFNNGNENGQAYELGDPHNNWDDGYPSGGNYWSDYTGKDNDGDGIGDTPYPIPEGDNQDRYPLMTPSIYNNTTLEIGYVFTGIFKINTEIKNIGEYPALQVNWSITLDGGTIIIGRESLGKIHYISSGESRNVHSTLILGFGQSQITITAEALNAEKVTKIIGGFILLVLIIIRQ